MTTLITGVSGVRGISGTGLTPEVALNFAQAFAACCGGGHVIVGRDSRISGNFLRHAVIGGLLGCGCAVTDIGLCGSPTLQMSVKRLKARGGIMITASHNPIQWNGMKFVSDRGFYLTAAENASLMNFYNEKAFPRVDYSAMKAPVEYGHAALDHIERVLKIPFLNLKALKKRKFKVVLDCVCGAGGLISPLLLEKLGCKVIPLYCEPTGKFPHEPEPIPKNLTALCRAVKKHKADVGFANDPDVDRLVVASEKGECLSEECTLAMAVDMVLSRKPGNVFINFVTSRMIDDIAAKYGCTVGRAAVGEINVTQRMLEEKGVVGGEGNGGVMLASVHAARDAVTGMALILQHMLDQKKPISAIADALPKYFMDKQKFSVEGLDVEKILDNLESHFGAGKTRREDGIRIEFDRGWAQVRKSNTEPIIRISAESPTQKQTEDIISEIKAVCFKA